MEVMKKYAFNKLMYSKKMHVIYNLIKNLRAKFFLIQFGVEEDTSLTLKFQSYYSLINTQCKLSCHRKIFQALWLLKTTYLLVQNISNKLWGPFI